MHYVKELSIHFKIKLGFKCYLYKTKKGLPLGNPILKQHTNGNVFLSISNLRLRNLHPRRIH